MISRQPMRNRNSFDEPCPLNPKGTAPAKSWETLSRKKPRGRPRDPGIPVKVVPISNRPEHIRVALSKTLNTAYSKSCVVRRRIPTDPPLTNPPR